MKKIRIAVFDFNTEDCAETAAAVRSHFSKSGEPAEVMEFTGYQPFVHDFKCSRDAGTPYDMTFIGVDSMMGVEVARHIRDLDEWCPIFLVSAVSDFGLEGYRLRALHYLTKPASAKMVKSAVERIGAKSLAGFQDPKLFIGVGAYKQMAPAHRNYID